MCWYARVMEYLMPAAVAVGSMYFATKASRTRGTKVAEWSPNSYPWREEVDTDAGRTPPEMILCRKPLPPPLLPPFELAGRDCSLP